MGHEKKGGIGEIKRDDPLTVDARKETEEGRGADREKWHIRRIRESIQRADSLLLDRISPAMPGRPPPALNTQASQDRGRGEVGEEERKTEGGIFIFSRVFVN